MSELALKVLNFIENGYTINDISVELNLSHKEIYTVLLSLKEIGMKFDKKYYYDGEIIYLPKKDLSYSTKKNAVNLITSPDCDSFKAMVISDLHIGSKFECLDKLNMIYDYCVNNGINIIINAGDILDGINIGREESKKFLNPLEQIEYACEMYPFDKNILNFIVLGNHDIDSLSSFGIDFSTYLRNFRHDLVPLGYGYGRINVKNDKIFVTHPLCIGINNNIDLTSNYLLIKGHHHSTKSIIGSNGNCSFSAPSLSNIFISEDEFLPGAMVLTIKLKNGFFDTIYMENLLVNNRVNVVSTLQYSVLPSKDRKFDGTIKYEENFNKRKILKKENK